MQVTLLQSGQTILTTFTGNLQQRALDTFRKTGVDVRLGVRVTEVTEKKVMYPPRLLCLHMTHTGVPLSVESLHQYWHVWKGI